jgi:mycothiol synthase
VRVVRCVEVKREMSPSDIAHVSKLLDAASSADGHQALSDHQWLDLVQGGRQGFAGLLAWEPGGDRPVAYAQVSRGNDSWGLELVVDPAAREDLAEIAPDLLRAAIDTVAAEGGGHLHWWVSEATADHDALAAALGLRPGRLLHQMRRPLPTAEPITVATRPFVVGRDESAWLEVNNRAFHYHPEQGGWTLDTIAAREREPWFDPDGFLLHERDGRLAAFCWTKVHTETDPPLGEIYVIGVDPDFQGLGLGRALTLAGLDHLGTTGLTMGMLYVDADNVAAMKLYEAIGFTIHHSDRAYVGDIAPLGGPTPITR